jgi:putative ABC transport system ATP-binding protein
MFEIKKLYYKDILFIPSLVIPKGSFTAIVGRSGGGKSTFLLMLNKMLSPTEGEIYLEGRNIDSIDSVKLRRRVLYLNQKPYIFEGNVKDNLVKGLVFQHRSVPDDKTLEDTLNRVHLFVSLTRDAKTLSGGEAQRLALARLLLLDGDVYLFDEPSSALDEKSEIDVLTSVFDWLKSKQKTLIMVTHSKAVANKHTDRVLKIENGQIEEVSYE